MAIMVLLAIPVTIFVGMTYLQDQKYLFISLLVMIECMIPFFLVFEGRHPKARELVIISVLCAIAVAGRLAFTMLPQFKPVVAMKPYIQSEVLVLPKRPFLKRIPPMKPIIPAANICHGVQGP